MSGALSHLYWEGPLTFTIMMVAQRVVEQPLSFRQLIEIAGEVTWRLAYHLILQAAQCRV